MHRRAAVRTHDGPPVRRGSISLDEALRRADRFLKRENARPSRAGRPNYERDGHHVTVGQPDLDSDE